MPNFRENIKDVVYEILSDPLALPRPFTEWIPKSIEVSPFNLPISQLIGYKRNTYTPVLTAVTVNPTLGTGSTQEGFFYRLGKIILVWWHIKFGSAGAAAGTGSYRISVPVTGETMFDYALIGPAQIYDNSADDNRVCFAEWAGTSRANIELIYGGISSVVDNDEPWIWSNNDELYGFLCYEAAS